MCSKASESLISAILLHPGHVLHLLLPPIRGIWNVLRPIRHNRFVPHLTPHYNYRKGLIIKMLYSKLRQSFIKHVTICLLLSSILLFRCFIITFYYRCLILRLIDGAIKYILTYSICLDIYAHAFLCTRKAAPMRRCPGCSWLYR